MRRIFFILSALLIIGQSFADESRLMRFADVSQDKIVFTYEDDLWIVDIDGGIAKRITRADGLEIYAKFSPDGSKLAFTANYDGGNDVYIMDSEGGIPKRLTWHPASDLVLDWFPDGKYIMFRSRREYPNGTDRIYKVSISGGMPVKLPVDQAGLATLSDDGESVAYNRISREFRTWKRYKGGMAQDIWVGKFSDKNYRLVTSFNGTDNWPMWRGDNLYFTSDRNDGTMNLYMKNLKSEDKPVQLTFSKLYDVKYPSIGPNHIVYQQEGFLNLYDLNRGKTERLKIDVPTDGTILLE